MRIAAIDIGTNSLHMIIVRTRPDGSYEIIGRERDMVRLGTGGLDGRPLTNATMAAAVQTLTRFKRLAESRHVDQMVVVATSAVREAPNGGAFLRQVQRETSLRPRIISGQEEARLIHLAAMHAVNVGTSRAVVIDIGGGSVELSLGTAQGPELTRSYRLGVIRLSERFVRSDPLSRADERRLSRHISPQIGDFRQSLADRRFDRVIGTSGTILSLGALAIGRANGASSRDASIHHQRVSASAVHALRKKLVGMTLADRLRLPGLDPRRADLVVAGAVLLDLILSEIGAEELTLCDMSLREGVVLDFISRHQSDIERLDRYPDIRRRSAIALAERCAYSPEHANQVQHLSRSLFAQTRRAHALDPRAGEWLEFAALLHDIGEHISYENHHRHSCYLIKNGDLRGFEPSEVETIALAARYHRGATPKKSHQELGALPRRQRDLVRWLAALLRVAESLDRSHGQVIESLKLNFTGRSPELRLRARDDAELERWAAQRNIGALEDLVGAPIAVEIEGRHGRAAPRRIASRRRRRL